MKAPYSLIVVEFVILNNYDYDITYFQSPISCAKSMISSGGHGTTDQDQGREMLCGSDAFEGQLLATHLLHKVHSLFWACKDSPLAKTINTLTAYFFPFLWDQVFASQIKTKEEIGWVKLTSF